MANIRISVRGFAEVSAAAPERKQTTLNRYRSPNSAESVGRSNYYVKALSLIKHHHKGDSAFVASAIRGLLDEGMAEVDPRKKTKLLSNHRAITDYLKNFGTRKLTIKPGKFLYYMFENLVVSAQPDLVADENGRLLLIKLNLSKKDFPGGVSATLLQVLYEAALSKGLAVKPTGVELLQTSSGTRTAGPLRGFPSKNSLDAACHEFLVLCKK